MKWLVDAAATVRPPRANNERNWLFARDVSEGSERKGDDIIDTYWEKSLALLSSWLYSK